MSSHNQNIPIDENSITHSKSRIACSFTFCSLFTFSSTVSAQTWDQLGPDFVGPSHVDFAKAVSISANGNTVAFGLPKGGTSMGSRVQIFNFNGSSWTQKGNTILSSLGGKVNR